MIDQEELQKMYDEAQKTLKKVEEQLVGNFHLIDREYDDLIYSEKDADIYGWNSSDC